MVQTTLGILFLARKYEKSKYCLHSHGENLSVVGIVFTTGKLLTRVFHKRHFEKK